ncbi:helix-turn-helix transcriptional regulator [Desulfoscipio gibsoniae]
MPVQTIEIMVKWVENHLTEDPTLKDMSSYVGYSPFYCSAKFREYMGMTYKQFLAQRRLTAAANDLRSTDDKITDIAFRYGYSSSESLTKAFGAMFKCSPRQYRKASSASFEQRTPQGIASPEFANVKE